MKRRILVLLGFLSAVLSASCGGMPQSRLVQLPLSAMVTQTSEDGKGWMEQGVIGVTYVQAEGQFKSALAQSGWSFQHKVSLTGMNNRALYSWKRGGRSVTVMLWRIDVGRTGFSWGVSAPDEKQGFALSRQSEIGGKR